MYADYALSQLIPVYRTYQSATKASEEAASETGEEAGFQDVLAKAASGMLDPTKRFTEQKKMEDLKKQKEYYDIAKKTRQENVLREDLRDALADRIITKDNQKVIELRKQLGMSKQSFTTFKRENNRTILERALKKTKDPNLLDQIREDFKRQDTKDDKELSKRSGD